MRISWKGSIATVATAGLLVVAADYVSFATTGAVSFWPIQHREDPHYADQPGRRTGIEA